MPLNIDLFGRYVRALNELQTLQVRQMVDNETHNILQAMIKESLAQEIDKFTRSTKKKPEGPAKPDQKPEPAPGKPDK